MCRRFSSGFRFIEDWCGSNGFLDLGCRGHRGVNRLKMNDETATVFRLTFHGDAASERTGNALDDGETQADPASAAEPSPCGTDKRAEDRRPIGRQRTQVRVFAQ